MNGKELEALADKYQLKADEAYQNYQETGIARYDRERRRNEDLAGALRMAAAASDDHRRLINMRGVLVGLASDAKCIESLPDDQRAQALERLRKNLLAAARLEGIAYDLS